MILRSLTLAPARHNKRSLLLTLCMCVQDPAAFSRYGVRPPRGVLLWGPPGTGKSALAVAAAADAGASLLLLQGPDVLSQYVGDTEASVQVSLGCAGSCECACWLQLLLLFQV